MSKNFTVVQNKLRLDRFLAESFNEVSRARIQKDIKAGLVRVNGRQVLEGKFVVRKDDRVEYDFAALEKITAAQVDFKTILENKDILIIDKPAGLVVHPAPGYRGPTLAAGLLHKYKDIKVIGEDEVRPGIVHRLDKDTSGIMLVAKTQKMFVHLKNAFQEHAIKKQYIALVCGNMPNKHGFINDPIGRHPTDFRQMTTIRPKEAKEAITEYSVLEQVDGYTLVRVNLHTGRTHQIRVHFSSLGFPLAGDSLYGKGIGPQKTSKQYPPGLQRQFLHASNIELQMPDKTWISAHSDLPDDLQEVLKELNFKNTNL